MISIRGVLGTLFTALGIVANFGCSGADEQGHSIPLDEQHHSASPDALPAKSGQTHDAGSRRCGELQQEVQAAIGDEGEGEYKNHGAYISAVANLVSAAVQAGEVTDECSGCIVSQFAQRISVADHTSCGPPPCDAELVCDNDATCDDGNPCTADVCDDGCCEYSVLECAFAIIGSEGGSVVLDGISGVVQVDVPPGAVDTATMIAITETLPPATSPENWTLVGDHVYDITASSGSFDEAVTITLPIGTDIDPELTYVIMWFDEESGLWTPIPSNFDQSLGVVSGHASHFSSFGAFSSGGVIMPIATYEVIVVPHPGYNQSATVLSIYDDTGLHLNGLTKGLSGPHAQTFTFSLTPGIYRFHGRLVAQVNGHTFWHYGALDLFASMNESVSGTLQVSMTCDPGTAPGSTCDDQPPPPPTNEPPVAFDQTLSVAIDATSLLVILFATDDDTPIEELVFSIVAYPDHGYLSAVTHGFLTYTPDAGYVGQDSFTFKANDGDFDSTVATVSITVSDDHCLAEYGEDFSSNPGWTTDQPGNYFWDAATETFHARIENSPSGAPNPPPPPPTRFAYTAISYDGNSLRLEFDLEPTNVEWSAAVIFGLFDEELSSVPMDGANVDPQYLCAHFGRGGSGRQLSLRARGLTGIHQTSDYLTYSDGIWYRLVVEYDYSTDTATLTVTERDSGASVGTTTLTEVGGLPNDLDYLGFARDPAGADCPTGGYDCSASATAFVDNIQMCEQ